MLSEEEKAEIEAEIGHYEHKGAVAIDAMKIVQRHRGWVSDESIKDVAELLQLTPDELDGVATFYNLIFRKPVGKHLILVCNSVSCWIMGYERVREQLKSGLGVDLGETTADNQFTVLPIACLGTCDHAPAMMIDDDLHRDLVPDKVSEIIGPYRSHSQDHTR